MHITFLVCLPKHTHTYTHQVHCKQVCFCVFAKVWSSLASRRSAAWNVQLLDATLRWRVGNVSQKMQTTHNCIFLYTSGLRTPRQSRRLKPSGGQCCETTSPSFFLSLTAHGKSIFGLGARNHAHSSPPSFYSSLLSFCLWLCMQGTCLGWRIVPRPDTRHWRDLEKQASKIRFTPIRSQQNVFLMPY